MAEKKELLVAAAGAAAGAIVVSAVATQDQMVLPQAGDFGKTSTLVGVVGGLAAIAVAWKGSKMLKGNARTAVAGLGGGLLGTGIVRAAPSVFTSTRVRSGQVRWVTPVATPLPVGATVVRPAATV